MHVMHMHRAAAGRGTCRPRVKERCVRGRPAMRLTVRMTPLASSSSARLIRAERHSAAWSAIALSSTISIAISSAISAASLAEGCDEPPRGDGGATAAPLDARAPLPVLSPLLRGGAAGGLSSAADSSCTGGL